MPCLTLTAASPDTTSVYLADTVGGGIPAAPTGGCHQAKVISTFLTGFYVRDDQQRIFAVGGPGSPAGPIHLALKHPAPQPKTGSEIRLGQTLIELGSVAISLSSGRRFKPDHPSPQDLDTVISARGADDPDTARRALQGRGDDVLAGLLLFCAWSGTASAKLRSLAQRTRTNDLSRAVHILRRVGHSSGTALLTGLSLAARLYWKSVGPPEAK